MEYKVTSYLEMSEQTKEVEKGDHHLFMECDVVRAKDCYRFYDRELTSYDKVFISIYDNGDIVLSVRKHTQSVCEINPMECDLSFTKKIDFLETEQYVCKAESAYKAITLDK